MIWLTLRDVCEGGGVRSSPGDRSVGPCAEWQRKCPWWSGGDESCALVGTGTDETHEAGLWTSGGVQWAVALIEVTPPKPFLALCRMTCWSSIGTDFWWAGSSRQIAGLEIGSFEVGCGAKDR